VERVRTRRPDRLAAAGVLGLGWLSLAARKVGNSGQARPTGWIMAQQPMPNKKFFSFLNLFYKLQINLNSNQI
jgi:hypothetical protein